MDVLVAGGHGQIARRLLRLLAQHGHTGRGLIRNPDHVADLSAMYGRVIEDGPMRPYLLAKQAADNALMESGLDWTVVKPGRLTNEPGSGNVDLARSLGRYGEVPRDDVALVLLHTLTAENTIRASFDLLSGPTPASQAVATFT